MAQCSYDGECQDVINELETKIGELEEQLSTMTAIAESAQNERDKLRETIGDIYYTAQKVL